MHVNIFVSVLSKIFTFLYTIRNIFLLCDDIRRMFFEKNIMVYQIFILHKPALLPAKTTLLSGRKDEQTIL